MKAYVAVIRWDTVDEAEVADVVFAVLTKESLEVVTIVVLYSLSVQRQVVERGMRCFRTVDAFTALDQGMFSRGAFCFCALGVGLCDWCEEVDEEQRMFVRQPRYEGRYPRGRRHWWTGLTDCAGEVSGVPWTQCVHSDGSAEAMVAIERVKAGSGR